MRRDTTAPTVTGTINANNATDIAINTAAGATFSEGMDPLTITNLNFTLLTLHSRKACGVLKERSAELFQGEFNSEVQLL